MQYKLSIITINFNNRQGLLKTIQSITLQNCSLFEYIIIDGGSTDGSVDLIKANEENISYWISEKDEGIYHAMNKGIAKAKGEYLMFLNSGDYLTEPYILENCMAYLNNDSDVDVLYGDINVLNDSIAGKVWERRHPKELDLNFWKKETINHQASFIKAHLFIEFGYYPMSFKLASDYWLFLKSFVYNKRYKHIDFLIVNYDMGGKSSNNMSLYFSEMKTIWNETVPGHINKLITENENYKRLTEYKIVKSAIKLNEKYQRIMLRK